MIPFYIEQAMRRDFIDHSNIATLQGFCDSEQQNIDHIIIHYLTEVIHEFSSDYNIQITSFNHFCQEYWKTNGFSILDWEYVFRVYYFDQHWIEWNVLDFHHLIFNFYNAKYNL
jgi:hypothetical protein